MEKTLRAIPPWLLMLTGLVMVVLLGYLDVLTGDYSLLIFYAAPVALEAWFFGRWGALIIALAAGAARFVSDYVSYSGSGVRYWNSLQDMVFLLLVGLLIAKVSALIAEDRKKLDR